MRPIMPCCSNNDKELSQRVDYQFIVVWGVLTVTVIH